MHLRIETTLFLRSCVEDGFVFKIMCRRWRWDKLNSSFNFSKANFFRITKPIENSKESMIAELKNPLNTLINTSYSQRTICEACF